LLLVFHAGHDISFISIWILY